MASHLQFLLLLLLTSFLYLVNAQIDHHLTNPLVLEINKDVSTLQYLAEIHRGSPLVPTRLVLDLSGPFAWMDCDSSSGSFSGRPIPRGSVRCLAANAKAEGVSGCALSLENKIGRVGNQGDLVEETTAVDLVDRSNTKAITAVGKFNHNFLFACAPKSLFKGLARGAKGMLGLGRARISLPSQISSALASNWQFSMCLSSSHGVVLVEKNNYHSSYFGSKISNSLIYTPLLAGQGESQHDYFINLKSINIGGQKLSLDITTTKLSTIVPYTTMQSSVYAVFAKAYERAALSKNISRVSSVAPFGHCFGFNPIGPEIDLVLQSELVKWRLYARNSLVRVSEEVMCLGFLDGGLDLEASIVLGGYQLEDLVLHFDVGNSMLGFSPSLLKWQMSCSDFKLESVPVESV